MTLSDGTNLAHKHNQSKRFAWMVTIEKRRWRNCVAKVRCARPFFLSVFFFVPSSFVILPKRRETSNHTAAFRFSSFRKSHFNVPTKRHSLPCFALSRTPVPSNVGLPVLPRPLAQDSPQWEVRLVTYASGIVCLLLTRNPSSLSLSL